MTRNSRRKIFYWSLQLVVIQGSQGRNWPGKRWRSANNGLELPALLSLLSYTTPALGVAPLDSPTSIINQGNACQICLETSLIFSIETFFPDTLASIKLTTTTPQNQDTFWTHILVYAFTFVSEIGSCCLLHSAAEIATMPSLKIHSVLTAFTALSPSPSTPTFLELLWNKSQTMHTRSLP